jgi:non-ribosomal peptide synthase protein (TIGR01720 family)
MIHRFQPGQPAERVPIGVPAANTQIYLLDERLQPVPVGVAGQIYIGGAGLAQGYLFQPLLTQHKFIDNPFLEGRKMYKTGDLGSRMPSGILQFLGRIDQQIKLSGYRIEPAEIEQMLLKHEHVEQAVALLNEQPHKSIYVYYTLKDPGQPATDASLRRYLAGKLPFFMVPEKFIRVDSIPLKATGKIDAKRLQSMAAPEAPDASGPATPLEAVFLEVWREVLGNPVAGLHDNFFALGGDSIKAVQITARLAGRGIALKPKDILTYHTVQQVCANCAGAGAPVRDEQGMAQGAFAPTPIQSWFFGQQLTNPHFYTQSVLLKLHGPADVARLETAFGRLVEHHDTLRINHDPQGNRLYYNPKHLESPFRVASFSVADSSERAGICNRIRGQFDLSSGLLLKAAILREAAGELLFITAHHLLMDGISCRNETCVLPAKTASFRTWSECIHAYANAGEAAGEAAYWDAVDAVDFVLPADFETANWSTRNLATVSATLGRDNTHYLLREAHTPYNTDVPMLLNAALVRALRKWTNQTTFVVEQENHGRHLEDVNVSRTLGWFTTLYPLQLAYCDDPGLLIKSIKEQTRRLHNHGIAYGMGRYIHPRTPVPGKPAEVRLNYLGQFGAELDNDLFAYLDLPTGAESDPGNAMTAKLEINCLVVREELRIAVSYNAQAHRAATIDAFSASLLEELATILDFIRQDEQIHFTATDFAEAGLNDEELNALFG